MDEAEHEHTDLVREALTGAARTRNPDQMKTVMMSSIRLIGLKAVQDILEQVLSDAQAEREKLLEMAMSMDPLSVERH